MPEVPPAPLHITTPMGPIEVDPDNIRDIYGYVAKATSMDIQDEEIKNFLGDSVETKRDYYSTKAYVGWGHAMMTVINRDYDIVKITNYNNRMTAEASPIWLDERIRSRGGEETRIKVPHRMTMYLSHKDKSHDLVITFYPYDTYELDLCYHFVTNGNFDYTHWKNEIKESFSKEGIYKNRAITADFEFLD